MEPCKQCGGETIPNPKKVATKWKPQVNPKLPDFLCAQQNGPCGTYAQYTNFKGEQVNGFNPTPAWKPKEGGFGQYAERPIAQGTPMAPAPNGQDGFVPAQPVAPTSVTPVVDYAKQEEEKVEGMVRHGVVCAMIQAGKQKDEILMDYDMYTKLIITGSPI